MTWIEDYLPARLLLLGPGGLRWWQWLALPLLLALAWLAGFVLARTTLRLLGRAARRTVSEMDDGLVAALGAPFTLAWTLGVAQFLLSWLGPPERLHALARKALQTGLLVALFWTLLRVINGFVAAATASRWAATRPGSRALVSIAGRMSKVALASIGAVAVTAQLGYPIASLIAGLGIGGLAVALAGQKTVENLFGAFSLGVDQPVREGDFVRVEDFVGTVETIGLRSTRIRTLDRTLITIPNGRLAEMRLESFTARDRFRLACTVGLVYATTAAQLRRVIAGLEEVLRAQPKLWPDAVIVRFEKLGASSLDIEVMAWFTVADWDEFQLVRQEVLFGFLKVVEESGTSFAFPTRTVQLASESKPPA
jgi:MscS family membrane protein